MRRVGILLFLVLISICIVSCSDTIHLEVFKEVQTHLSEDSLFIEKIDNDLFYKIEKNKLPTSSQVYPDAIFEWNDTNSFGVLELMVTINYKAEKKLYNITIVDKPISCHICEFNGKIACVCEKIPFSVEKYSNWGHNDYELDAFDIWDVKSNDEISSMVFFHAETYEQFLYEIGKASSYQSHYGDFLSESFLKKLKETYDIEFFKDNILLFYYKNEGNISENYVHSVVVKDNTLTLNVNRFEGMATALSSWLSLVAVQKNKVTKINEYNVTLRTVSPLQNSISVPIKEGFERYIYLNSLNVNDFNGLENLKSVDVFTWSLMVDVHFNKKLSDTELSEILEILNSSNNVSQIGYTSNEWIRVVIDNSFYDKHIQKLVTIVDLFGEASDQYKGFSVECRDFTPIVMVTLNLETPGKYYALLMIKHLKELNLPFIDYDEILT